MDLTERLKNKVLCDGLIDRDEALALADEPLDGLCRAADEIRLRLCGNTFDICTIINGKCGKCSEDCKYCAQSAHYRTKADEYPLLPADEIVRQAEINAKGGVLRYSIVTSGRRLPEREVQQLCESIRAVREQVGISVCVSLGLLELKDFELLKQAGASRVHCNLETSRRYFPYVCTTHTYDQKIETLMAARKAGLDVCSGGIIGLGETVGDRTDLALTLRGLDVRSVPVNFLNPIKGTPFENNRLVSDDEKRRTVALFRFVLPSASIRLAGGRGLIADRGEGCFRSGANAAISGDMLTTAGITIETDMAVIKRLGYRPGLWQ